MPRKKNNELKYEPIEKVERWNVCQMLASILYRSEKSNNDIIKIVEKVADVNLATLY